MLKKLLGTIIALLCATSAAHAGAVAPDVLIRTTVDEVLAVIKSDKDIQAGDQQKTTRMVEEKVLPHFDFERMTQLAVGKNWRTATPEQKQALTREFRNMLVRTYTKVFSVYRDQIIDVKTPRMASGDTEVTVQTTITKQGTPPIPVNYEMRMKNDAWKVFDIYIEGVSMVMSYRGTFNSQIEADGIDSLIKTLTDKNTSAAAGKVEAK